MTSEVAADIVVESIRQGGAVLVALASLLAAVGVPTWRRLGKIKAAAEATQHQTQNDHGTNLRDDVDQVMGASTRNAEAIEDLRRQQAATHNAVGAVALELRLLSEKLEGAPTAHRRRWWRRG